MKRHAHVLSVFPMAAAALLTGAAAPAGSQQEEEQEIPFAEASLFFELNDTDGDLGIHGLVDGDEWKKLEIEDPFERSMLDIQVTGRLRRQGLTELFFESAEPTFDELPPRSSSGGFRKESMRYRAGRSVETSWRVPSSSRTSCPPPREILRFPASRPRRIAMPIHSVSQRRR